MPLGVSENESLKPQAPKNRDLDKTAQNTSLQRRNDVARRTRFDPRTSAT